MTYINNGDIILLPFKVKEGEKMLFKYNIFGYDKEGYNRKGFDKNGFDRNGFDKYGYDKNGYDVKGYDKQGFDRNGYNSNGFDRLGFDLRGYDKNGYDKQGFNSNGYDINGFNKNGYNANGYDKQGYDINGYDINGFDKLGFDLNGYDKNGYNKQGFNSGGYNRDGYDKNGYDSNGYDKQGFDISGFNSSGFDKDGYTINGLDKDGYNKQGFNCEGYDRDGYDKNGYDSNGYDRQGFNISGFNSLGFDKNGYDINVFDKGGYDRQGFNDDGYNISGFNRLGYDKEGFDIEGYNIEGFNINGYDRDGYDINGYNSNGYNRKGEKYVDVNKIINLTKKTYTNKSFENLNELGDVFYSGSCGIKNFELANYIYDIAKGKKVNANEQYYSTPTEDDFIKDDSAYNEHFNQEKKHLENVKISIDNDIVETSNGIKEVEKETWWMDFDQKNEWRETTGKNRQKQDKIFLLQNIKKRPYYARMDTKAFEGISTVYIGEEPYNSKDSSCSVSSVWSEVGRRYREKRLSSFRYNGTLYEIQLRRNIDIKDSELINIYDEFNINSDATREKITDLYLLKVLEEKKGEKNITNIIRSIQLNQNTIIDYDFQKNLLVQGCAGSGKTMILLHRLANMKFNNPNMDYKRVKIITPNSNFNLFIDELSKNLHIEQIPKMTIGEYWIDVISRYRVTHTVKNDALSYSLEDLLTDDFSKEVREIIYSKDFANELKISIEKIPQNLHYTQEGSIRKIDNAIEEALCSFGLGDIKVADRKENNKTIHMPLTDSILYSKVLALFLYYGPLNSSQQDTYLCVDEGQDISLLQYGLMLRINRNNVKLNVYGDINQQIPSGCNIEDWDYLLKYIQAEKFVLNENYRNSEEIIQFYNQKLSMSNLSFGLKTKEVEKISHETLSWKVLLNLILGNRTAIICNDYNLIPNDIKEFCSFNDLSATNKANVLTVRQAKGLEYDTVFVYDNDMNKNERYIAYTRALSELYILE